MPQNESSSMRMGRRDAIKVAAAMAAPLILGSRMSGAEAPSNALRIGLIGSGRMGMGNLSECMHYGLENNARVVAVCDVDAPRALHAKNVVEAFYTEKLAKGSHTGVGCYADYRDLLDRDDIDGVIIATPEHWHARSGIDAAKAGKDLFVQKPMTYSIEEGQKLVKAVRRNGVVLQVGSQQRSDKRFRETCERVRGGRIGKLLAVEVGLPSDGGTGVATPMPVPEGLDYDFWMGPTAEMPYTEHRVHPQEGYGRPGWLQIERYCLGMITGWGSHMFDIAQWGVGCDLDGGPVEISATGEFPDRGLFDVHTNFKGEAMYANGVRMTAATGPAGVKFIGEDGWIWVERGAWKSDPESLLEGDPGPVRLYESDNHMGNFLDCMRSRQDPCTPVEAGHRSNTVCVLFHIAMKLGRPLKWDPKRERFEGDREANKMRDYGHRRPWRV
jgi:myo-inositol 2-dehydrogenase / D-chiro-inositol 1-dehydrogenase